jgi:hypothetical protein
MEQVDLVIESDVVAYVVYYNVPGRGGLLK